MAPEKMERDRRDEKENNPPREKRDNSSSRHASDRNDRQHGNMHQPDRSRREVDDHDDEDMDRSRR